MNKKYIYKMSILYFYTYPIFLFIEHESVYKFSFTQSAYLWSINMACVSNVCIYIYQM